MKKIKILEDKKDTYNCPICKNDDLHLYTQMFYNHYWCDKCHNYFRMKKHNGKIWIFLLNINESNIINIPISKYIEESKKKDMKKL